MAYLDHASATPLHPAAREALLTAQDHAWADPARRHGDGRRARAALDQARESIAHALGARPDETSFHASGEQAAHRALRGALAGRTRVGRHLVVSAIEHSAVLAVADELELAGGEVTRVAVDRQGRVDVGALSAALRADTAVVSLQSANPEVGTRQPVPEVAALCATRGLPLHVDASASVGNEPVDVGALGIGLLTASAQTWGGPAGVGVLVVRKGARWRSPDPVDARDPRAPGFPNVPAVVAAAAALQAVLAERDAQDARLRALVDVLRAEIPRQVADVEVVGDPVERLPHVVTASFLYVDGEALVDELDRLGHAVTSGSACASATGQPSHVLEAMGVLTQGNLRISLGRSTSEDDVRAFLADLPNAVAAVRERAGAASL